MYPCLQSDSKVELNYSMTNFCISTLLRLSNRSSSCRINDPRQCDSLCFQGLSPVNSTNWFTYFNKISLRFSKFVLSSKPSNLSCFGCIFFRGLGFCSPSCCVLNPMRFFDSFFSKSNWPINYLCPICFSGPEPKFENLY